MRSPSRALLLAHVPYVMERRTRTRRPDPTLPPPRPAQNQRSTSTFVRVRRVHCPAPSHFVRSCVLPPALCRSCILFTGPPPSPSLRPGTPHANTAPCFSTRWSVRIRPQTRVGSTGTSPVISIICPAQRSRSRAHSLQRRINVNVSTFVRVHAHAVFAAWRCRTSSNRAFALPRSAAPDRPLMYSLHRPAPIASPTLLYNAVRERGAVP